MVRSRDPEDLRRQSVLLGRRVTPETLPLALLERWDVRFAPVALFAGRTLSLAPPEPLGSPAPETFRTVVELLEIGAGKELSATAQEALRSRRRGEYIRTALAGGAFRRSADTGPTFTFGWLQGGGRLAGKAIRINGEHRTIRPDFSDGWQFDVPIQNGIGQVEILKQYIGDETQIVVTAPPRLRVVSPTGGRLYSAPQHVWQSWTGSPMSELSHTSRHGCGGAGCKGVVFHFVAK